MYTSVRACDTFKAYHRLARQYHPDKNPGADGEEKVSMPLVFALCTDVYNSMTCLSARLFHVNFALCIEKEASTRFNLSLKYGNFTCISSKSHFAWADICHLGFTFLVLKSKFLVILCYNDNYCRVCNCS